MKRGENFFKVTKRLMLVGGIWRLELVGVPKTWQLFYKIYSVLIQFAYYTSLVSITIKFFELWPVDKDKAVECLSMLIIIYLVVIKMGLCQTKRIKALLAKSIQDVNNNSLINDGTTRNIFSSFSRYTSTLNIFITVNTFGVGLHLIIIGIADGINYQTTQNNFNTTEIFEKPIAVLYWYPFDINEYYGMLSMQLKLLQHHIRNFTIDISTRQELCQQMAVKNIKLLAKKHQEIIAYIKDLNENLKYLLLIEYGVSSLMLAAILVQILGAEKVMFNVQYFLLLAFQWCMLSWNANEITIESERLSYALYESRWYDQSKEAKQIILIMMLRCKKPLSLGIGPFGPLNNDAAVSRLKLAYSYVSLISGNST